MKKLFSIILIISTVFIICSCDVEAEKLILEIESPAKVTILDMNTQEKVELTEELRVKGLAESFTEHEYTESELTEPDTTKYEVKWYDLNGNIISELILLNGSQIEYEGKVYEKDSCDYYLSVSFYFDPEFRSEWDPNYNQQSLP